MFEQKHPQHLQQDPQQQQQQVLASKDNIQLHPGFTMGQQSPALITSPSGLKVRPNQHPVPNEAAPFPREMLLPRPQFYGHNPNLKLPPDLFLLGCIFFVVEYDEYEAEVPQWKQLIRRHGGEIEAIYCPRVTHVLCKTQQHGVVMQAIRDSKRCVTAYWLNDTIILKQVLPPSQALHLPAPSTFGAQRPASKYIIAISGFSDADERERLKKMVDESGALFTSYLSRHNSLLICKRPDGSKYKCAKDWNIPVVNCAWLSDILQGNLSFMTQYDHQRYQPDTEKQQPQQPWHQQHMNAIFRIDYSLAAHLMNAWKSPINLTQDSHERVKRLLADQTLNEPKTKKVRVQEPLEQLPEVITCNEKPEYVPRVLFSQIDNLSGLKNAVTILGGEVVTEPEQATHIVLTRLVRTSKLLMAVCTVDHVLNSRWISDSAKAGKFLPTNEYVWHDNLFNELYNCDIQTAIKSPKRRSLLSGKIFYITPSVRPQPKDLIKIIELCGGKVELKRRSASQIEQANAEQPESYIILTCTKDIHLLVDLTKPGKPNRIICATEYVLSAIMQQKLELEPYIITYF